MNLQKSQSVLEVYHTYFGACECRGYRFLKPNRMFNSSTLPRTLEYWCKGAYLTEPLLVDPKFNEHHGQKMQAYIID